MWLKLSAGWQNMDHLLRVEFATNPKFTATLISIKPGGSDRTFVFDDDARIIQEYLEQSDKTKKKRKAD